MVALTIYYVQLQNIGLLKCLVMLAECRRFWSEMFVKVWPQGLVTVQQDNNWVYRFVLEINLMMLAACGTRAGLWFAFCLKP